MSEPAQKHPPDDSLPEQLRRLVSGFSARDRADVKWQVGSWIERAYARLSVSPSDMSVIDEVVVESIIARMANGPVRDISDRGDLRSITTASYEAIMTSGLRRVADLFADAPARDAIDFIVAALLLWMNMGSALMARGAKAADLFPSAEEMASEGAKNEERTKLRRVLESDPIGGLMRAQIMAEVLIEIAERQEVPRRAEARELLDVARHQAERGAERLLSSVLEPMYSETTRWTSIADRETRWRRWCEGSGWAAWWLVRRTRTERDVEALANAASILAEMGVLAVGPILNELDAATDTAPPEQIEALLGALRNITITSPPLIARAANTLRTWLRHRDADLRERAVSATKALPSGDAVALLEATLEHESDGAIVGLIRDELDERLREAILAVM